MTVKREDIEILYRTGFLPKFTSESDVSTQIKLKVWKIISKFFHPFAILSKILSLTYLMNSGQSCFVLT